MNKYEFAYLEGDSTADLFYVYANEIDDIANDVGYINEDSIYEIECEHCVFYKLGCLRLECPTWTGGVSEISK